MFYCNESRSVKLRTDAPADTSRANPKRNLKCPGHHPVGTRPECEQQTQTRKTHMQKSCRPGDIAAATSQCLRACSFNDQKAIAGTDLPEGGRDARHLGAAQVCLHAIWPRPSDTWRRARYAASRGPGVPRYSAAHGRRLRGCRGLCRGFAASPAHAPASLMAACGVARAVGAARFRGAAPRTPAWHAASNLASTIFDGTRLGLPPAALIATWSGRQAGRSAQTLMLHARIRG